MSVDPAVVDLLRSLAPVLGRWGRWYLFGASESGMSLDVVLAGPGLEQSFLERAAPRDVGGFAVPVITGEDLMIAKILAGRPKDIEDANALWRALGKSLDVQRIDSILELIERALDRSDLRRELAAIRSRWPAAGREP